MVAQNGECLHEGPAVGVQLGKCHVDFSQERPLEPRERQAKFDPLEDGDV